MADSLEKFEKELKRIGKLFWAINYKSAWTKAGFSVEKACVCAAFSKIAYLEIPDHEVRRHDRAKIIPCLAHQEQVRRSRPVSLRQHFRRLLGMFDVPEENLFTIETRSIIVVGVVTPTVIFIAFRGTDSLTDWFINLDCKKLEVQLDRGRPVFHEGFYFELTRCLPWIAAEINLRVAGTGLPVYVVGHSLGGALAAIMRSLGGAKFLKHNRYEVVGAKNIETHSCYTFGMPRFGNDEVVKLNPVFHVYNEKDIVPAVPPRSRGFANVPHEYRLNRQGQALLLPQDDLDVLNALSRAHLARGIRHHFIERYLRRLMKAAKV